MSLSLRSFAPRVVYFNPRKKYSAFEETSRPTRVHARTRATAEMNSIANTFASTPSTVLVVAAILLVALILVSVFVRVLVPLLVLVVVGAAAYALYARYVRHVHHDKHGALDNGGGRSYAETATEAMVSKASADDYDEAKESFQSSFQDYSRCADREVAGSSWAPLHPPSPTMSNPYRNPLPGDAALSASPPPVSCPCYPDAGRGEVAGQQPGEEGDALYHQSAPQLANVAPARQFYTVPDNVGCAHEAWLMSSYQDVGGHPPEGSWRPPGVRAPSPLT